MRAALKIRDRRLTILTAEGQARRAFADDVRTGLLATPKRLSCQWLYDEAGSRLFEEISAVPEYYIPAAEREILAARSDEIAAACGPGTVLIELGSGSAQKTRLLIEALLARGPLRFVPIDVSASMLEESSRELVADYPRLEVVGLAAEYETGLLHLDEAAGSGPRLFLWLGSNIGNFTRAEAGAFLERVRRGMRPGDAFLLGVDLRKDAAILHAAYDDPAGVTARFSKNILARINRELGGHFDLDAFAHRAAYHEIEGRIAIHLVSRWAQCVPISGLGLSVGFAAGEAIHTEDSFKYSLPEIAALAELAGLEIVGQWTDRAGRFSETLLSGARPHA